MRRAIVLGLTVAVVALGSIYLTAGTERASHAGSPAFQASLNEAIARLEGIPQEITAASVGVGLAHAGERTPTVDEYTCSGFRTCDQVPTCDGTPTCDGEETCWWSTYAQCLTCDGAVPECCSQPYTMEGEDTCNGTDTCHEGCAGWPTYFPGWPTCTGEPTCEFTCPVFVSCHGGGPTGSERTTWGQLKAAYSE